MSDRRYWYHCTVENHGQRFTNERRPPIHRSINEPTTPRICVCPHVPNCFAAVLFPRGKTIFVYRTVKRVSAIKPRNVWDDFITQEHWIVDPVEFELFATVTPNEVEQLQGAIRLYHLATRNKSCRRLRAAQFCICWDVLGNRFESSRGRYCCRCIRRVFEIGDSAEDYVLQMADEHAGILR